MGSQVLWVRGTRSVGVGVGLGRVKESGATDSSKEKRKHLRKWDQAVSRGMDPDSSVRKGEIL